MIQNIRKHRLKKNVIYHRVGFVIAVIYIINFFYTASGFCGTSYIDILSEPEGVDVLINGKPVGKTPVTGLEVPSGTLSVRANKEGQGKGE